MPAVIMLPFLAQEKTLVFLRKENAALSTESELIMRRISLLELAEGLQNVSHACRLMHVSRDTFYRVKRAYEEGGIEALRDKSRRKTNMANRVAPEVEQAVLAFSLEHPTYGQVRVSDELRRREVWVSPGGVRCIWLHAQSGERSEAAAAAGGEG